MISTGRTSDLFWIYDVKTKYLMKKSGNGAFSTYFCFTTKKQAVDFIVRNGFKGQYHYTNNLEGIIAI